MSAIQPRILTWARETAGFSREDAAHLLGLTAARGKAATERLEAMEVGEEEPSRTLIAKMAKVYRRPLITFYLAEPPRTGDRGQDFRTLPGRERFNPELDALVRDIKARQGLIRSMLEDDEASPVDFVGSTTMQEPALKLAGRIAERIGFSMAQFRAAKTADESFAYLRERAEESGVYVLLVGNLGSFHSNLPVEVFRGFALADSLAPLVVVNDQDTRTAWSFTLLHEIVHLWLGQTGVSGTDAENQIERYCNDVAGEFLLPTRELRPFANAMQQSAATIAEHVGQFAMTHRVSRPMVAYKLYRAGMIDKATWSTLNARFRQEWLLHRQHQAEQAKKVEGGPNYYVVRRHRIGAALLALVRRSLDEGTITYTKASRVLGVKPRNVEPLLSIRGAR